MIAPIEQPVSSVVRIAQEACEAEGVSLAWLRAHRRCRGLHDGIHVTPVFQRVVWRVRQAKPMQPSFPEIAVALGRTNHSSIITAYDRECRRLDLLRQERLRAIGAAVAERAFQEEAPCSH